MSNPWTIEEAVQLCRRIEALCPAFGCHVALTGGVLYKDGARKDLDLLFYRIRQVAVIDRPGLLDALNMLGVSNIKGWGWCYKGTYQGKRLDLFFPDPSYSVRVEGWRTHIARRVRRALGMSA